jgi:hypothetical protein
MSALINSVEYALATAASDTVKVAKFVETSALPVLKKAQADQTTIEAVTSLVSPQAANIERAGFAVLGVVIKAIDNAGTAVGSNFLNVTLDAQLIADIKAPRRLRARCQLRLHGRSRTARHPLTRPDEALRKVLGMDTDDLIGFIHRMDDVMLATYPLTAHLEHASQSKYSWLRSHNHVRSSHWDGRLAASKTPDRDGGHRRLLRCG